MPCQKEKLMYTVFIIQTPFTDQDPYCPCLGVFTTQEKALEVAQSHPKRLDWWFYDAVVCDVTPDAAEEIGHWKNEVARVPAYPINPVASVTKRIWNSETDHGQLCPQCGTGDGCYNCNFGLGQYTETAMMSAELIEEFAALRKQVKNPLLREALKEIPSDRFDAISHPQLVMHGSEYGMGNPVEVKIAITKIVALRQKIVEFVKETNRHERWEQAASDMRFYPEGSPEWDDAHQRLFENAPTVKWLP